MIRHDETSSEIWHLTWNQSNNFNVRSVAVLEHVRLSKSYPFQFHVISVRRARRKTDANPQSNRIDFDVSGRLVARIVFLAVNVYYDVSGRLHPILAALNRFGVCFILSITNNEIPPDRLK